jgi:hypothetical protein
MGAEEPQLAWPATLTGLVNCLLSWGLLSLLCGGWQGSRGSDGRARVHFDLNRIPG